MPVPARRRNSEFNVQVLGQCVQARRLGAASRGAYLAPERLALRPPAAVPAVFAAASSTGGARSASRIASALSSDDSRCLVNTLAAVSARPFSMW